MTIKQIGKAFVASAIIVAAAIWFIPKGMVGFYNNSLTSVLSSASSRQVMADWFKKQGANAIDIYGADSYIGSAANNTIMADYILRLRRDGIKSVGFVYSSTASMAKLKAYNDAQKSDSTKFSRIVMEEEPYNTGNYTKFYSDLAYCSKFAKDNNLEHDVYIGWENNQALDSLSNPKFGVRIYVHAYGQYDKQVNVGAWIYGYQKSRLAVIASCAAKYKTPVNIITLLSVENPNQSKTQFGYKYFLTNTWVTPQQSYLAYFNMNATTEMKQYLVQGGVQIFPSDQAKLTRP